MAAPLFYQVKFEAIEKLPAIEAILLTLLDVTGLAVVATSRVGGERNIVWALQAQRSGQVLRATMHTDLFSTGNDQAEYIVAAGAFDKKSSYLVGSLLVVLTQFGGSYKEALPKWVGKTWQAVKEEWPESELFMGPAAIE